MARLLLTGFGSFPGAPANPSETIANNIGKFKSVALGRLGVGISTAILPVVYHEIETAIERLLARYEPDIVLHMGLATRRKIVTLETTARNRLNTRHPDASASHANERLIEKNGPASQKARWPAARLAGSLNRFGLATACSLDAGDYLCNQTLYLSLRKHDGLCGFVHLPLPRDTRRRKIATPPVLQRPSLADMESSIVWIIRQMAVEYRRTHPIQPVSMA